MTLKATPALAESEEAPRRSGSPSSLVPRLITGVVIAAFAVTLILTVPVQLGFLVWLGAFFWASTEFVGIAQHLAPTAPLRWLWLFVPAAATAGFLSLRGQQDPVLPVMVAVGAVFAGALLAALACLLSRGVEARDAAVGMGILSFATPYFAVAPVAVYWLHAADRWLVFLLLAIVAIGDSMAYFAGRAFGRTPLAPRVSPNKTWEGSLAGFAGSVLAAAVWAQVRMGEIPLSLLALAAVTAVMAQLGDLVESLVKRGAGVKDSSQILPGHGGLYDRLDAMLLAAPTFAIGLWLLGGSVVGLA
ncbi:MAG: phosphatidate cytidylyltransferase [Acidobacteriota bacterium]